MLYIKSYLKANGKSFVIKEAEDVENRNIEINLSELWEKVKNESSTCDYRFTKDVELAIIEKANIQLDDPYQFISACDFDDDKEGTVNINVICYVNEENEKRYFVPAQITYIVNENGATIATIA